MKNALKSVFFAAFLLLPELAFGQCAFPPTGIAANTVIGRLGIGVGPCQQIPFATLSAQLTGASITLNSGNGQTAPGHMAGGNTYSFGATTDTPQFTGVGLGGTAPATGLEVYNAAVSPTGNGQGMLGATSSIGGFLIGQGSVFDSGIGNKSSAIALGVLTGTVNMQFAGQITAANLATVGSIAGAICATSGGLLLYEPGVNCYAVSGISVTSGKTLTVTNTITLSGTDGTTFTFPGSSDTVDTLAANQTVSGNKTFSGTVNITGTGQINGAAFGTFATANAATPPAIGGTTPAAIAATTLTATTPIGLTSGGTNASTAAGARASGGLDVDAFTAHGDSNYVIQATDRVVGTSASLTTSRTWTLPAASTVNPGQALIVADFAGGVTGTNTLVVQRAGSDTVNGSTSITINTTNSAYLFVPDGISKWTAQALGSAATTGVSSVNGQNGSVSVAAGTNITVSTGGGNITVNNAMVAGNGNILASGAMGPEQTNPGGRLTLTSATPVTTADVTGAGTVYYAPMTSRWVPIFNGSNMQLYNFTSSSTDNVGLTLTLGSNWASGSNYDAFIGLNSSTVTLCTGPAWSSDTARGTGAGTTELQLYQGFMTNKNSMTCRYGNATTFTCGVNQCTYIGSFRATGSGTTEDSLKKRFVSNVYNQQPRPMAVNDATASWTYSTTAFRQADGNAANQLDYLQGLAGPQVTVRAVGGGSNSGAGLSTAFVGIGIDSTVTNINQLNGLIPSGTTLGSQFGTAYYDGFPGIGRHFIAWLEYGRADSTGTTTWFGTNSSSLFNTGITGTVWN